MKSLGSRALLHNSGWAVAGQLLAASWQWIILVIQMQGLGAEQAGRTVLALAIIAPVFAFSNGQLGSLVATGHGTNRLLADYFYWRVLSSAAGLFVCLGVALALNRELFVLVTALATMKLVESFGELTHALHQRSERMERAALSQLVRAVLCIAVTAMVAESGGSAEACAWALVGGQLLTLLTVDVALAHASQKADEGIEVIARGTSLAALRSIGGASLSLSAVIGLNTLSFNLPRYWLAATSSPSTLAVFALISYLMTAGNMLYGSICQAALPRLARYKRESRPQFVRLSRLLVSVAIVMGAIGIACAVGPLPTIISWLYSTDYEQYRDVIVATMTATAILYLVSQSGCLLTSLGVVHVQSATTVIAVLVNVSACAVLVPRFGLLGGPLALGAAFVTKLLLQWGLVWRELRNWRYAHGGIGYLREVSG